MSCLWEELEKYDYYPVLGDPKNGFYPVPKGLGTYYWNGERIVPKDRVIDILAEMQALLNRRNEISQTKGID